MKEDDVELAHDIVSRTNPAIHVKLLGAIHKSHRTPHRERKFDGKPKKWCSKCPFPEGCIVCCLD
jgi:hypothetical protein